MPNRTPEICEYMTPSPLTAPPEFSSTEARELFQKHRLRHLPVVDESGLIGVVSDRDLRVLGSVVGVNPDDVSLREVMTSPPYQVGPHEPLEAVVSHMSAHRIGSAVVVDDGKVVGIFTAVDALEIFGKFLRERAPSE